MLALEQRPEDQELARLQDGDPGLLAVSGLQGEPDFLPL